MVGSSGTCGLPEDVENGCTMKTLLCCLLAASASVCAAQATPVTDTTTAAPAAAPTHTPATGMPNIPKGSKVFVEPMGGFETYLSAAILNKKVPVQVVDNKANADFIISGGSKVDQAGWAKTLFVSPLPHATASIAIKSNPEGVLVFAYAVDKSNARKADQSTAEACAKHMKDFIEKGEKK